MQSASNTSPEPRVASVKDTAAMLDLSVPTVYRLLATEQLDSITVGRRRLIKMASIKALIGEAA